MERLSLLAGTAWPGSVDFAVRLFFNDIFLCVILQANAYTGAGWAASCCASEKFQT
jgi:hypothetical protein